MTPQTLQFGATCPDAPPPPCPHNPATCTLCPGTPGHARVVQDTTISLLVQLPFLIAGLNALVRDQLTKPAPIWTRQEEQKHLAAITAAVQHWFGRNWNPNTGPLVWRLYHQGLAARRMRQPAPWDEVTVRACHFPGWKLE